MGRQTNLIVNDNGEVTSTATDYAYRDVSVFDTERGRKEYTKVSAVKSTDEDGYISSETYTTVSGLVVREKKDGIYTDNVYDDYGTLTGVYVAAQTARTKTDSSVYI